jgi:hypothetical protein
VRPDGSSQRIRSGDTDDWYTKAVEFITSRLPRRYSHRALPFDKDKVWSCDKLLAVLLPPSARLTAIQPGGSTLTYIGEEDLR